MNIWIDGDACPKPIKQILFRAAVKRKTALIIVANHLATIPPSPFIKRVKVESGFDRADKYIVQHLNPGDVVITADVILAADVITKDALALNPRGTLYSSNNMQQLLSIRHVNESLREGGMIRSSIDPLSAKEIQTFSNHLDKLLTKAHLNNKN